MAKYARFTAEFGDRKFRLRHLSKPFRVLTEVAGSHWALKVGGLPKLPVAYEYLGMNDTKLRTSVPELHQHLDTPRNFGIIKVVAGPMVSLSIRGFPSGRYDPNVLYPMLEIIRVQDADMVPPIGSGFKTTQLLGEYEVNPSGLTRVIREWVEKGDPAKAPFSSGMMTKIFFPDNYFTVSRLNNGVQIRHWNTLQDLHVTVPRFFGEFRSGDGAFVNDAFAKFAFKFNDLGVLDHTRGGRGRKTVPLLEVVTTPAVRVTRRTLPRFVGLNNTLSNDIPFFRLHRVSHPMDVPHQGEDFTVKSDWSEIPYHKVPVEFVCRFTWAAAMFDTSMRFLPAVGTALDLLDVYSGMYEGHDIYGCPITQTEAIYVAYNLILPGVAGSLDSVARYPEKLKRLFGRRVKDAEKLFKEVRRARVSRAETENVKKANTHIRSGSGVAVVYHKRLREMLARIDLGYPQVGTIISRGGAGFVVSDLQEGYRRYSARQARAGRPVADPVTWAVRQTRGQYANILTELLGSGWRKSLRSGQRLLPQEQLMHIEDFPRPIGYTDSDLRHHLDLCLQQENYGKLVERLQDIFPKYPGGLSGEAIIAREITTPHVSRGLLGIVKGNIAEVFSGRAKRRLLQTISKKYSDAFLLSGVRIDWLDNGVRVSKKGTLLFSDDIIARFKDGNLELLAVFEVKSGYGGGQTATRQIFDWNEMRLTAGDGSKIVLPKGARLTRLRDGQFVVKTLKKRIDYTYKPPATGGRAPREVKNLLAADRYILTAKGQSHLGINSSHQSVRAPVRLEIEVGPHAESSRGTVPIQRPPDTITDAFRQEDGRPVTSEEMDYLAGVLLGRVAKF